MTYIPPTKSLLLLTALLAPGCANDTADGSFESGKADDLGSGTALVIAQADAFSENGLHHPVFIHVGLTDEALPGWEGLLDIDVEYDNDRSLAVSVDIAEDSDAKFLAFVIASSDRFGRLRWSEDQFIDLDNPEGAMVRLPINNSAGYPFADECYEIQVRELDSDGDLSRFQGIISNVSYGFTDSSVDEYLANNDVPWFNVSGEPAAAGFVQAPLVHDGGFKGSMVRLSNWIRVPAGSNLVYKPNFSKASGSCFLDGDTVQLGTASTKTFFYQP